MFTREHKIHDFYKDFNSELIDTKLMVIIIKHKIYIGACRTEWPKRKYNYLFNVS